MFIATLIYLFNSLVIFEGSNASVDDIYRTVKKNTDKDVILLKYEYTTGVGWYVIDSNKESIKKENIILSTPFNPRLLRINRDYYLDYTAKFVVVVDKYSETKIEDKVITVIYPRKIVIQHEGTKKKYYPRDMQMIGIIRFLCGIVFNDLWYCK